MLPGFIAAPPSISPGESGKHTYSALAPNPMPTAPNTWSPTFNFLTSLPTDSISPAISVPGIVFSFGFLKPIQIRIGRPMRAGSLRLLSSQSPAVTVVAWIFIRTSSSLGVGLSNSRTSRTSGGPYAVQTTAFIATSGDSCCDFLVSELVRVRLNFP